MRNTSRRRLILAAGAILTGTFIPIAVAGSVWADVNDQTEDLGQLIREGLSRPEAMDVVHAENTGLPVEVSYDGQVVVDDNEPTDAALLGAVAESGPGNDVAASIATNSPAIENETLAIATNGSNDVAFADGGGSFAEAGNEVPDTIGSNDSATAIGTYAFAYATAGSNDLAVDQGSNSFAVATGDYDRVYDYGSGVGNGVNDISAGGDHDLVIGVGNGLPNTDVVNTGVFDLVRPAHGNELLSSLVSAFDLSNLDPAAGVGAAADAAGSVDPLSFLGL